MLRLVIPVDGSEASHRAIDAAVRLAKDAQVEVVVVHVREGDAAYHGELTPSEYERIHVREREQQAGILDEAMAYARRVGLQHVTAEPGAGTPEIDIPAIAAQHGADIIVMATRGLGAVGSLLLGSTTQRVVHNAKIPVLLVK